MAYRISPETWYQRMWRPMMAAIYMMLCVLDYGVRPAVNYFTTKRYNLQEIVRTIKDLDPMVQLKVLEQSKVEAMPPILNEFTHLAFGTILGISAFSRSLSKGDFGGNNNQFPQQNQYYEAPPQRRRKKNNPDENIDEPQTDGQ